MVLYYVIEGESVKFSICSRLSFLMWTARMLLFVTFYFPGYSF